MTRRPTVVQLSDELMAELDAESRRRGTSRSALIREAITACLAGRREVAVVEQIVDGYRRLPPATPDEWGDVGAMVDRAAVETMQRLDAEERAAGLEPW